MVLVLLLFAFIEIFVLLLFIVDFRGLPRPLFFGGCCVTLFNVLLFVDDDIDAVADTEDEEDDDDDDEFIPV